MANFRYAVLSLLRQREYLIWCLGLPLVLTTLFIFMFKPLDALTDLGAIPFVAVEPNGLAEGTGTDAQAGRPAGETGSNVSPGQADQGTGTDAQATGPTAEGTAFRAFVEGLPTEGDLRFSVTWAKDREEAEELLLAHRHDEEPLVAAVTLGDDGKPSVTLVPGGSTTQGLQEAEQGIIVDLFDGYLQRMETVRALGTTDPAALGTKAVEKALESTDAGVEEVSLTTRQPRQSVQFFFSLMGFTILMTAQMGLMATMDLLPGAHGEPTSSSGHSPGARAARITASALPRWRQLALMIGAAWTTSMLGAAVNLAYATVGGGIDFGDRLGQVVAVVAVGSAMATGLGALIAVVGPKAAQAKSGILTLVTTGCAFFAGLYGKPVMVLANGLAQKFPVSAWVNPARQVMDGLMALVYYDSLDPFWFHLGILGAMAVIFFILAAFRLRRSTNGSL